MPRNIDHRSPRIMSSFFLTRCLYVVEIAYHDSNDSEHVPATNDSCAPKNVSKNVLSLNTENITISMEDICILFTTTSLWT